jgi:hypothetical protein
MHSEFFHEKPRAEAYDRLKAVMARGTVCLRGAVCFVTEEGCRLLRENIALFRLPGSYFIAGYNEISAIPAINELCNLAPGAFHFHGVAREGSEDAEGHLPPGLMHDKLIYAEGESEATVWVGSHNFTHNALRGVNIEAATITTGDKNHPFFRQVRAHLESIRNESFEGPAPIPRHPAVEKPIRELLLVHCEASDGQIQAIRDRRDCYISVHLRQDAYDSLCRPPANPDKHVRLLLYPLGALTKDGPTAPAALVKAGELYGVNFTEKSIRRGNTAGWPEVTFRIEEPQGDPFQPLRMCTATHDPTDDVTVCAIRVDNALEEPAENDTCCILAERPRSEVKALEKRVYLSPLADDRRKRYVVLIEKLKSIVVLSGLSPIASNQKMGQIFAETGEEVAFGRNDKKPFRFIHNAKLFALPRHPDLDAEHPNENT